MRFATSLYYSPFRGMDGVKRCLLRGLLHSFSADDQRGEMAIHPPFIVQCGQHEATGHLHTRVEGSALPNRIVTDVPEGLKRVVFHTSRLRVASQAEEGGPLSFLSSAAITGITRESDRQPSPLRFLHPCYIPVGMPLLAWVLTPINGDEASLDRDMPHQAELVLAPPSCVDFSVTYSLAALTSPPNTIALLQECEYARWSRRYADLCRHLRKAQRAQDVAVDASLFTPSARRDDIDAVDSIPMPS